MIGDAAPSPNSPGELLPGRPGGPVGAYPSLRDSDEQFWKGAQHHDLGELC